MPAEKSSGLEMSRSTLPARASAPARPSTASEASPLVALTTTSAEAAASAKVASAMPGWAVAHVAKAALPIWSGSVRARVLAGSRVPMVTAWPSLVETGGDGAADGAGAENCVTHGRSLGVETEIDRSVY